MLFLMISPFLYKCHTLGTHQTCKANGQGNNYIKGNANDCVFPFIHKNKKYIGCATGEIWRKNKDIGASHYCATKIDSKGNLAEWARCNKFCKHDAERKFNIFTIFKLNLITYKS